MIEIYPNVWVGDQNATILSYNEDPFENEWYVLHCCKEPYHRQFVGYISRGAPKDHPEYLFARRGNRMALNMVDAPKPEFFSPDMIKAGLDFLEEGYKAGKKLLIHCNQGESRGPSVAMLFVYRRILHNEDAVLSHTFEEAEAEMRQIYPAYNPGEGIRAHLQQCWGEY
jgi:hypothetical protein